MSDDMYSHIYHNTRRDCSLAFHTNLTVLQNVGFRPDRKLVQCRWYVSVSSHDGNLLSMKSGILAGDCCSAEYVPAKLLQ